MRRLVAIALVAGVALAGCSSGGSKSAAAGPAKSTNMITIKNFRFTPAVVTVKAGTVVTWTNQDSVEHSATSDDKTFDSKTFGKGKSYSYTFTKAGTYGYHCTPHQYMTGKVIVTA
ncbi:MAG: plastocyanin/azurin family copper-binding protein [Mycobacteriales bacterium]